MGVAVTLVLAACGTFEGADDGGGTGSPSAVASEPIDGSIHTGAIAYSAERGGKEDVYLLDLATGEVARLTSSPAKEFDPDISPDGSQIAYRRNPDPQSDHADIWLMDLDGSHKRNLTHEPESDNWSPAWSPDGSRIAFASTRDGGTLSLWTMAADGSDLRRVTEGHGEYPDWSPDGRWLVYAAPPGSAGTYDLWIVAAEGGEPRQLTSTPGTEFVPAWSPDGSSIAYQAQDEERWTVRVIRPDGTGDREVSVGEGSGPFWSPNGLLAWEGPGGWSVARPDGSDAIPLGGSGRLASWAASRPAA